MVKLTYIARLADAHPLAEGLEMDSQGLEEFKRQGKNIVASLSRQAQQTYAGRPDKVSADAGVYMFHYTIFAGVVFLTLTDKAYPRALAFEYLEELKSEFMKLYGSEVDTVSKHYAFVKFDTFIQRTRKLYLDHRTHRNLEKLQGTLAEVHQVMTQNIQDILGQGSKLDRMTEMSAMLSEESKAYHKRAKDMYFQALLRKYLPFIAVGVVLLVVLYLRWRFY